MNERLQHKYNRNKKSSLCLNHQKLYFVFPFVLPIKSDVLGQLLKYSFHINIAQPLLHYLILSKRWRIWLIAIFEFYNCEGNLILTLRPQSTSPWIRHFLLSKAVWTRFFPLYKRIFNEISNETIGKARLLRLELAIPISNRERIRSKALGGGALLDMGVYPLNIAVFLFGKPDDISVQGTMMSGTGEDNHTPTRFTIIWLVATFYISIVFLTRGRAFAL